MNHTPRSEEAKTGRDWQRQRQAEMGRHLDLGGQITLLMGYCLKHTVDGALGMTPEITSSLHTHMQEYVNMYVGPLQPLPTHTHTGRGRENMRLTLVFDCSQE